MLLLLLGILFLHIAVLVLLFVSTIVSVSAGGRAGGQGRLPAGRQLSLLWVPRCFSKCQSWDDICRQLNISEAQGRLFLHFLATRFFSVQ